MTGLQMSKSAREKRDKKVIELYQQGISFQNIRLRFGVNVGDILKKHGIECNRYRKRK